MHVIVLTHTIHSPNCRREYHKKGVRHILIYTLLYKDLILSKILLKKILILENFENFKNNYIKKLISIRIKFYILLYINNLQLIDGSLRLSGLKSKSKR